MGAYFIGIVGYSGSGKTTLIVKLIDSLTKAGYVVGAIKHDAHSFEIDYPGKDSYRMKHAGAKRVVLSSYDKLAVVEDRDKEKPLNEIKSMFDDCDIVLVEGYKLADLPKIEVHRKDTGYKYLIESGIKGIVAIATDEKEYKSEAYVFDIDNVESISAFLENMIEK